ncbi:RHS repeat-associated core domain-containing protein [Methylomonas fluvii]|uniref:DUF4329 domain-containing protein n=1 Tax=Methylomonas fluvii TaxID=1854564 RepID=A0ABR9DL16_9GAMM|nr:RHS repeat-associated core domain-containing protein [Methylomonas fluvii]MBD9363794.1 DUF4329 domain-containing protein [Methylomonas fluvii]
MSNGLWQGDTDSLLRLTQDASGYTLTDQLGAVERYNAAGRIVTRTELNGQTTSYSYDSNQRLSGVTGPFGHSLQLAYDTANRISSVIYPDGLSSQYQYDSQGNLNKVIYQDGSFKLYHYENTTFPHALTGITDENGNRYATWSYDSQGRANLSKHADGVEQVALTYNSDGSTDVVDSFNASRHYTFQTILNVQKLTGISQPAGAGSVAATRTQSYDANGNLASHTDFNGNLSCYAYDLTRNLETTRIEGLASGSSCPANLSTYTPAPNSIERKISSQWHASYRLPTQIDQAGQRINLTYDAAGNLLNKTILDTASQQSRTWTWTYNNLGQILTADGPRTDVSDVTTYTYYADSTASHKPGDLWKMTNALGHVTTFNSYDANGRPLSIADPNGLVISLSYDARGRLTQKTVDGNSTQYTYDAVGNLTKVTLPTGVFINYSYDAAHRLTDITDALGGKLHYTLDAMGNRTKEDILDSSGAVVKTRSRVYDALNRLAQDIGAYNQTSQYQYDANGNLTKLTDANGHATLSQYDSLNRLIRNSDALNGQTDYFYDAHDQLTQVTDPRGLMTNSLRNGFGDRVQLVSPDTGNHDYGYDATGNLISATDADGVVTSYDYDSINRPIRIQRAKAGSVTESATLQYDQGINGLGRLTGIASNDDGGSSAWRYDLNGRLIEQQTGGPIFSLQRQYDADGRVSSLTYPSGRVVAYHYDAAGRISQIDVDGVPTVTGITWQALGSVQGWTWAGSGIRYNRDYDLTGRITTVTLGDHTRNLVWNGNNRISQSSDEAIATPGTPTNPQSFGYDELDRLNQYQSSATHHDYGYDADGNRISKTVDGGRIDNRYEAVSNRLSASATQHYQYDAVGRVVSDGVNQYRYNNAGRLVEVINSLSRTWYYYNGLGQRSGKWRSRPTDLAGDANHDGRINLIDYRRTVVIAKGSYVQDLAADCNRDNVVTMVDVNCVRDKYSQITTDPQAFTHYIYDPAGHLSGEYRQLGDPIQETVYLGDTPVLIMMQDANATALYTIDTDHLDTPRVIKNNAGAIVWRWDQSEPFGISQPNSNPSGLGTFTYNLRFPGQYYDQETGLHYNMERYYHPGQGRYLQSDPIGLAGGINTYTYVGNNPLLYTDRYGLRANIDTYRTPDEAAVVALLEINAQSISENREYSGSVYKIDGESLYRYTETKVGDSESSPLLHDVPGNVEYSIVELFHTHAGFDPKFVINGENRNNIFSPEDIIASRDIIHKPNVMINPDWNIQKYDPKTAKYGRKGKNVPFCKK